MSILMKALNSSFDNFSYSHGFGNSLTHRSENNRVLWVFIFSEKSQSVSNVIFSFPFCGNTNLVWFHFGVFFLLLNPLVFFL